MRSVALVFVAVLAASPALANPFLVPEIDAGAGAAAIAVVATALALIRGRSKS